MFDPILIEQARREIDAMPYGHRTAKATQWALLFNTTPQTLYRLIGDPSKKRARKSEARKPEYVAWAKIIWQVKNRPPEDAGVLSTEDAISSALKQGLITAEAAEVPVGTYNTIARKQGWNKTEKRRNRIQAAKPNDCHHFDGSSSAFFHIARRMPDGEYVMKMHRPAAGGYKNKPIPVDRLRPYYYGLTDDHSGRLISKCYPLVGEDSGSSMTFLMWAWSVMGLCVELAADEGMLKRCLASSEWVGRLGVKLPEGMPYEKEAHGKIEVTWKTTWRKFELTFYAEMQDWKKFDISLTEFNAQLSNFLEQKYNQMPHRFERDITRMQAWNRVNLSGGIVQIPENALATVARRISRKVDVFGNFDLDGVMYEVKGLHDAWIWVWQGVFEDQRIVAQDQATGIKYEVKDFKPLVRGEFRGHKETPHQEIVKASMGLSLSGKGLYATPLSSPLVKGEGSEVSPEKGRLGGVVHMPIKTKETREIEDPFDVSNYPNIEEGEREFYRIVGPWNAGYFNTERREEIREAIIASGLSRNFVETFALEVRANMNKRAAM